MLKILEIGTEERFNELREQEQSGYDYLYLCKYSSQIVISDNGTLITLGQAYIADGLSAELKTKYDEAVEKKHLHENKEVLDAITSEQVQKWNNQNAFSAIVVEDTVVKAQDVTDALALSAGDNVDLVPDTENKKIVVKAKDTVYTHPESGVKAGTYKSVTVDEQGHVTGGSNPTVTVAQGGTGATTAKGAEYNLLKDMVESTAAVTDDTITVCKYTEPDSTKGVVLYKKTSLFWDYIKSKISSVLGLSETGLASGKSIGGIKTISETVASNSTGNPTYLLMFDVTTWYNSTTTNQSKIGFTGLIYSVRAGGNMQDEIAEVRMGVSYSKATSENGSTLLLRSSSSNYQPCIVHDITNDKYYLSLRIIGYGGRPIRFQGVFSGTYVGTKINTTNSNGALPDGYEIAISDYRTITHARATADANGNVITDTYATQTEVSKKWDSTISRTANTVLASPDGKDGAGSFRKLVANDLPTIPASKGGTGKTTLVDSANALINSLTIGNYTPKDNDYYVSQYVNGGTTTTTYHRRPVSALWDYIKSKTDSIYVPITRTVNSKALSSNITLAASDIKASDSKTLQTKVGAISGITSDPSSKADDIAISTNGLNIRLGGLTFAQDSEGNWGYKPSGADSVIPFKTGGGLLVFTNYSYGQGTVIKTGNTYYDTSYITSAVVSKTTSAGDTRTITIKKACNVSLLQSLHCGTTWTQVVVTLNGAEIINKKHTTTATTWYDRLNLSLKAGDVIIVKYTCSNTAYVGGETVITLS